MIPAILTAIVLAVLIVFGLLLTGRLRIVRRKPRRRDSIPLHIQQRLVFLAFLKRCRRGLRYPTVAQKKRHAKMVTQFLAFAAKQNVVAVPNA